MSRRSRILQTPPGVQLRAVGYVRVSTGKQALSPEAQREKIEALAHLQGVHLVEVVEDRETAKEGSIHKRPGVLRMLELIRTGKAQRILIPKLDRLTRSVVDLGELLTVLDKYGASLASASETWMDTGSAAGRLVINIIVSVAQWEREAIAERTAAVLQHKKQHHKVYNHEPYGWIRDGDSLVEVPLEQAARRHMAALRKAGATLAQIAHQMNADGLPTKGVTRKGVAIAGRWYPTTVSNILKAA